MTVITQNRLDEITWISFNLINVWFEFCFRPLANLKLLARVCYPFRSHNAWGISLSNYIRRMPSLKKKKNWWWFCRCFFHCSR